MLKKIIPWSIISKRERRYQAHAADRKAPIVVIGCERSGTSMVSQLVEKCGVYFGDQSDLMRPDSRNPRGFMEHNRLFSLCRRFLREAKLVGEMSAYGAPLELHGLRSKGFRRRISRFLTRRALFSTFESLARGGRTWGFKTFPLFFYFLRPFVPNAKLIGVYRAPHANAVSIMKAWPMGTIRYEEALLLWEKVNRDLLFHLLYNKNDVMLVSYEDILNQTTRPAILKRLCDFVGTGSPNNLALGVDTSLNRSESGASGMQSYPLSSSVQCLKNELDHIAVRGNK